MCCILAQVSLLTWMPAAVQPEVSQRPSLMRSQAKIVGSLPYVTPVTVFRRLMM